MKSFTVAEIRNWKPCYDPSTYLSEAWEGTAIDILNHADIPSHDKLWVVLRTDLISEKLMRTFAVWCARRVVKPDADTNTLFVLEFMEAYTENYWLVDDADYREAWDIERSAAYSAAESADYAAESAARSAESAAWSAADYAADYAAQLLKLKQLILDGVATGDTKL